MLTLIFYLWGSHAAQLTAGQSAVITADFANIEEAFLNGVVNNLNVTIVNSIQNYNLLNNTEKLGCKNPFKSMDAAFMDAMNWYQAFAATRFTGTITLAKLTTNGANGSITFSDGFATAARNPT